MKKGIKALKITNEEFGFGLDFSIEAESTLKSFFQDQKTNLGEVHYMGRQKKVLGW